MVYIPEQSGPTSPQRAPQEQRFPVLWPELPSAGDVVRKWHERTFMLPQTQWSAELPMALERLSDEECIALAALQNVTAGQGIICIDGPRPNVGGQALTVRATFPRGVDPAKNLDAWYDADGQSPLRLISLQAANKYTELRIWGTEVALGVSRRLPVNISPFIDLVCELHEAQPRLDAWEKLNADKKPRPQPFFLRYNRS